MSAIEKSVVELLEGDEIAEDVLDANGQLIVPKGKILDLKFIQAIQRRDIEKVIINEVVQLSEEEIKQRQKEIVENVDSRFRNVKDHALMQDLRTIVIEHRLKKI